MPRKPRVENIGFHHIINRGVARGNIFLKNEDFEKFLEILQETKDRYDFTVHSFCLMSNHYHLLVETKDENLSLIARQINSKYAQYFNREYNRVGPLWQGRFKNYFVYDDGYLNVLVRYIERNPIKANMTKSIGQHRWSASSFVLHDDAKELLKDSLLYGEDFLFSLDNELSESDAKKIEELQKAKYIKEDTEVKRVRQKTLEEYFKNTDLPKKERNKNIQLAVKDGYKQSEIAKYLQLSRTAVSKVVNSK